MGDARVERHLGWVTLNGQRYPREKAADWLDAIRKQLCPFCGEGPFTVVAMHVTKKHGIDRLELRELLGIGVDESICDPRHSAVISSYVSDRIRNGQQDQRAISAMRDRSRPNRKTLADVIAHPRRVRKCTNCGASYYHDRGRKTCSDACAEARLVEAGRITSARQPPKEVHRFVCPVCGQWSERPAAQVRANRKQGWDGPFCGMSCAGKYRNAKRLANGLTLHLAGSLRAGS